MSINQHNLPEPLLVSASMLAADPSRLGEEVASIEEAKVDWLHWDVMDGNFVPNLTFGPGLIGRLRKNSSLFFDVHLMIQSPERSLEQYVKAGANAVTIHAETVPHLHRTLTLIRSMGVQAGLALSPHTHESILDYVLDELDLILVMSVNPGFGGQEFIQSQYAKIERVAEKIKGRPIRLSVDGGITQITGRNVTDKGAAVLVAGSYLFSPSQQSVRAERVQRLKASRFPEANPTPESPQAASVPALKRARGL